MKNTIKHSHSYDEQFNDNLNYHEFDAIYDALDYKITVVTDIEEETYNIVIVDIEKGEEIDENDSLRDCIILDLDLDNLAQEYLDIDVQCYNDAQNN